VRLRRTEFVLRVALVAAWCVAFALALAPPDETCSPADPLVCTTDATGGVALAVAFVSPVLLAVAPLTGCAAAVVFGVLDLVFDPDPSAHVGFGGLAGLAVVAAAVLIALRTAQGRIVRGADALPVTVPAIPPKAIGDIRRARAIAAGVLTVLGLALAFGYWRAAHGVADREHAAQRRLAVVTNHDDEAGALRLDVAPGVGVPVQHVDAYPVGSQLPVLVTGAGDDLWVRPVAEPEDVSWWLTLASAALLAAGLLEGSRRWSRARLSSLLDRPASGPMLLCAPDRQGRAVLRVGPIVLGVGSAVEVPVAEVSDVQGAPSPEGDVVNDEDEAWSEKVGAFGRAWRDEDDPEPVPPLWRPVTVVGDLRVGGWVLLVLDDAVLLPEGPVRSRGMRGSRLPDGSGADAAGEAAAGNDEELPGVPVAAEPGAIEHLDGGEILLRPVLRDRLVGAALVTLAAALLFAVRTPLPEGPYQQVLLGLLGSQALVAGCRRLQCRVEADNRRVVVPGPWRTYEVPWQVVHGIRRDGDQLALAWKDVAVVVGPFAGAEGPEKTAADAGVVFAALRERAAVLAPPDAPVVARLSPVAGALAGYALLVLAAVVW
jgi:hypothetical protein